MIHQEKKFTELKVQKFKKITILLMIIFVSNLKAQVFDERYSHNITVAPVNQNDPFDFRGFASCESVNQDKYVTVVSTDASPGTLICRFNEFDKNGNSTI